MAGTTFGPAGAAQLRCEASFDVLFLPGKHFSEPRRKDESRLSGPPGRGQFLPERAGRLQPHPAAPRGSQAPLLQDLQPPEGPHCLSGGSPLLAACFLPATQLRGVVGIDGFGSRKPSRVLLPEWPHGVSALPKVSGAH